MTEQTEVKKDTLREVVIQYLKQHPAIKQSPLKGVFPETIPQGFKQPAAAAVSRTFTDRKRSKLGLTGITESRVSITVAARRKLDAARGSDAIETALVGFFRGDMGGLTIKSIALDDQDDFYDDEVDSYLIASVYNIWHENEKE
ncbi:MAG: hypothetical protein FH749_06790 [Firmicutes bacterium]|nr:hypothetical protein [Bacillota bacterium]